MEKLESFFSGVRDFMSGTGFRWFNFDRGEGVGDFITLIMNIVFTIAVVIVIGFLVSMLFRYVLRYFHSLGRTNLAGKMVWSELEYSGMSVGDNATSNAAAQMNNMANIMSQDSSGALFGFLRIRRRKWAMVVRLDPDDEKVHVYIGVSKEGYDVDALNSWASDANCSVEKVELEDIGIIPSAPVVLVNDSNDYDISNITNQPMNSTVGKVISNLQNHSAKNTGATAMVVFESMSGSEQKLQTNHILGTSIKTSGQSAQLNAGPKNVDIMMSRSPCRATFMAFSDTGDENVSSSVLSTVRNNIYSMGVNTKVSSIAHEHRRSGFFSIIPAAILGVMAWLNFIPLWVPAVFLALTILTIIGAGFMSSKWISAAVSVDGSAPLPPFVFFSFRRLFTQFVLRKQNFDIDSGQLHRKYIAAPSMRQVLPVYQTSLMQFISMPINGLGAGDLSSSIVPQVAISSSVNNAIAQDIEDDKVMFIGTSVKNYKPVYKTIRDINYPMAFGGNAGSGKTQSMMSMYVGASYLSRQENGYTINPIWLETKSDDLSTLIEGVKGYDPLVSSIHDRETPTRLCLEGPRIDDGDVSVDDIVKNKNELVSAMEKLWGAGSFGPRSKMVADAALTVAYLMGKDQYSTFGFDTRLENPERPNIIHLTELLVGADPSIPLVGGSEHRKEGPLVEYADKKRSLLQNPKERERLESAHGNEGVKRLRTLVGALDQLVSLHYQKDAVKPLHNKLPVLRQSSGLWETKTTSGQPRREYSLTEWLDYGGPVIIDMTAKGGTLSDESSRNFTMFIHYMMWVTIQDHCHGWGPQGKYVPIFADEVTRLVGRRGGESNLSYLVGEMADLGRSYGVSHVIGFQNFQQMTDETKGSILNYKSKVYFAMNSSVDREQIIREIGDRTAITIDSINSFPPGYGIAQLEINGRTVPVFMMKTPLFKDYSVHLNRNQSPHSAFLGMLKSEKKDIEEKKKKKIDKDHDDTTQVPDYLLDDSYTGEEHDDIPVYSDDAQDDDNPPLSWG